MTKYETVSFREYARWAIQDRNKWKLLTGISCLHPSTGQAVVIRVGIRHGCANISILTQNNRDILLTTKAKLRELKFNRSELTPIIRQAGYAMTDRIPEKRHSNRGGDIPQATGKWQVKELVERNITHLCHFTTLQNLPGILKHGLLSRTELCRKTINFVVNDEERRDRQLDATCCSISFPNYKMFYGCRESHKDRQWAVLLLSTRILSSNVCGFYYSNASRSDFNRHHPELYQTSEAFLGMFSPSVATGVRSASIPSFYTTDPQAEILIFGDILPDAISAIHVPSFEAAHELMRLNVQGAVTVSDEYFKPRSDWESWPSEHGKAGHDSASRSFEEVPF